MRVTRATPLPFLLPMTLCAIVVSSAGWVALSNADEGDPIVVEDGKTISIEYTLKLEDGTVADTSEGREALQYVQGGDQILPALEEQMAGLAVGDERSVTLTPEQGYGVSDPNLLADVPTEQIPQEARTVGAQLMSQDQSGQQRIVRVHEVKEEVIVIDLNHPLAGETLHFDVKVVGIE
jgi:FKBP-type peptidyl-prolyl cis-trans isomerase 2